MVRVLMVLVPLAMAVYALVDCISTRDEDVRHLPKLVWILLIALAWVIGPLAWLLVGRRRALPGRPAGGRRPGGWVAPDDNPEFLRSLNEGPRREENAQDEQDEQDEQLLESWEEDLRRREEELRRKDSDDGGPQESPPGTT